MNNYLIPIIFLAVLGGVFGLLLALANKKFYVEVDPRITLVEGALPGANCGACGFPGCAGLASAIVENGAPVTSCPIGGAECAEHIAEIMGVNAGAMDKKVAHVLCQGTCENAPNKFDFLEDKSCREKILYHGGDKACAYGCLGGGDCFDVCEYGAIKMEDGIAHIIKENCVACNKCVEVCPKNIIELIPYEAQTVIECRNKDKGKEAKAVCKTACIGCGICVKNCPENTIKLENNLAKIDYSGCTNCGTCVIKCPTKAIVAEYEVTKPEPVKKEAPKVDKSAEEVRA